MIHVKGTPTLKLKILNTMSSFCSVISLLLTLHLYEITYGKRVDFKSAKYLFFMLAVNFFNVLSIVFMIIYQKLVPDHYKKSKTSLITHFFLYLICPFPDLPQNICLPISDDYTCYSFNELLTLCSFFKVFPFLLSILQYSPYYSHYRKLNFPFMSPYLFTLKALFSLRKFKLNLFIFLFFMTVFGYCIRIVERNKADNRGIDKFDNSIWHTFIAGFGIGIGDFYPTTLLGRIFSVIWIIIGAGSCWYLVLGVGEICTLNNMEFLVYRDINLMHKSVKVIQKFMQKKDFSKELIEFSKERKKILHGCLKYSDIVIKMKDFAPGDYRKLKVKVKKLQEGYDEILKELKQINKSLKFKAKKASFNNEKIN